MSGHAGPGVRLALDSLRQRLETVGSVILVDPPSAAISTGGLLSLLADSVATDPSGARPWLLATAVAGGFPTVAEVITLRRLLELAPVGERGGAVMTAVALTATRVRADSVTAELVDGVVVDVDFCAKRAHNTGIQRVVRNTVRHWPSGATLVAWSNDGTGYRRLTSAQEPLVIDWRSGLAAPEEHTDGAPLVIPLGGTVVLPEVPSPDYIDRLAALARFSGNRTAMIGYDAIPVVSADSVPDDESDRFAHYLEIVKYATVISGISETTAEEFRGFVRMFPAQGLGGPAVVALPLPVVGPSGDAPRPSSGPTIAAPPARPLVLMVGSLEPRKNQRGMLGAAQLLWERGIDFELQFIGGGSAWFVVDFERDVAALSRSGRPVSVRSGLGDAELAAAYQAATVVAFPSLQEGYGLPVSEALASGTPVVTTRYGSTAEIAAAGGCLVVDPRDDDAIAAAVESVLTDPAVRTRLIAEIARRTPSSWQDYAARLWAQLVGVRP